MFLMWKHYEDQTLVLTTGLLAMGSYAFVDRAMIVAPQALNMIFLPLVFYFYLKRQTTYFALFAGLMVWNHGFAALPCLGGICIYALMKRNWKPVLLLVLVSLPMVVPCIPYVFSGWSRMSGGYETMQEQIFWTNPLHSILAYQRLICVGLPLAVYFVWRWKERSELEKICLLTVASMAVMILPWADRFLQFSTIPLAVLLSSYFMKSKWRELWLNIVVVLFILFYLTLWLWVFADFYVVTGGL